MAIRSTLASGLALLLSIASGASSVAATRPGAFFIENPPVPLGLSTREATPEERAQALLADQAGRLGLGPMDDLRVVSSARDRSGRTHVAWVRQVAGLPLDGFEVIVHVDPDGAISAANGVAPNVTAEAAARIAEATVLSIDETSARGAVIADLARRGADPSSVSVKSAHRVASAEPPHVLWLVDAAVAHPANSWRYRVDAVAGTIVSRSSMRRDAGTPAPPRHALRRLTGADVATPALSVAQVGTPHLYRVDIAGFTSMADGDLDGFYEAFSFDLGIDADYDEATDTGSVAAVIRCTTTGDSWATDPWTITGHDVDTAWFGFTQADFDGLTANNSLDFTVELRSASLATLYDSETTVIGEPLKADAIPDGSVIASGYDALGQLRSHVDCDYDAEHFAFGLVDTTRRATNDVHGHHGQMPSDEAIVTFVADDPTPFVAYDYDVAWIDDFQRTAVSAHVNAAFVYDFLLGRFELNSFDGQGSSIVSVVDGPCVDNAFWDSLGLTMYYCQGLRLSGALDVVAHELGHAVTQGAPGARRDDLAYEGESGALNEAFSDWMGVTAEAAAGRANWTLGESIVTARDLSNPPAYGQPDTYLGTNWVPTAGCTPTEENDACGVHTNSGVPNKMFYLLAQGGTFGGQTVTGVGLETAMDVAFDANVYYWTRTADFAEARAGMLAAATSHGTNVRDAVDHAWRAVGVGDSLAYGDIAPRGMPDGSITVGDVVLALRFSVALDTPTPAELSAADVAPSDLIAPGSPEVRRPRPNGMVDVGDVVLLLRASVRLSTFG